MLGGGVLLFVGASKLHGTRFYSRIALTDTQESSKGYTSNVLVKESLKGKSGTAHTVLRPSGKVIIDGKLYDAYTRGDFIEKGQQIEVISDEGSALKVKSIAE
jgi:membrane-bound serine protease (ClpP class)